MTLRKQNPERHVPPKLTEEQRNEGLAKALELRQMRAELKRKLGAKEIDLPTAMRTEIAQHMPIGSLVKSLPGYGPARTRAVLSYAKLAPSTRVVRIGVNQMARLLKALGYEHDD